MRCPVATGRNVDHAPLSNNCRMRHHYPRCSCHLRLEDHIATKKQIRGVVSKPHLDVAMAERHFGPAIHFRTLWDTGSPPIGERSDAVLRTAMGMTLSLPLPPLHRDLVERHVLV